MNSVLSYMRGGQGNSRHIVCVIIKVIINAILFIMIFLPIVEVSNKYGVTNLKHEVEARCVQVIFIIMIFLPCLGKEVACHKLPHGIWHIQMKTRLCSPYWPIRILAWIQGLLRPGDLYYNNILTLSGERGGLSQTSARDLTHSNENSLSPLLAAALSTSLPRWL